MSDHATYLDAFNLLCGDFIGRGQFRDVFQCRLLPDCVVKVERPESFRKFSNVYEFDFWHEYKEDKNVIKWLAPCEWLSADGRILIQKKCDPVPQDYKLPTKLPSFLTDTKRANYGIYEGRLVCIDYAIVIMNPETKLRKANWWA